MNDSNTQRGMFVSNGSNPVLQFVIVLVLMVSQSGCSIIISPSEQNQSIIAGTLTITSDADLVNLAIDGSGSLDDPYIIRVHQYEDEKGTMEISNTRAYFVISESLIWNYVLSDYILAFRNVSHGAIEHSAIRGLEYSSDVGIFVEDCSDIIIESTSINHCGSGIEISESRNCIISNCSVYENYRGIRLVQVSNTHVLYNTIVFNEGEGIIASGVNNSIYGNKIGWNLQSAEDYGSDNFWDNGVDTGNFWDDYDGLSDYEIPGQEDSVDHYPNILQDGDYSPPLIEHDLPGAVPISPGFGFPRDQIKISVNVSDESGVDTVFLVSPFMDSVMFYQMVPDPIVGENGYSYVFEGPFTNFVLAFYVWANDTNGYCAQTDLTGYSFAVNYEGTVTLMTIALVAIGCIGVSVCIFLRRR